MALYLDFQSHSSIFGLANPCHFNLLIRKVMKNCIYFIFAATLLLSSKVFAQVQPPVMNPIVGPSSVCSTPAAPEVYFSSASNSPTSYFWTVLPSLGVFISSPNSSSTPISFPNTNLTYTVYCNATNAGGNSAPVSFVVTVFETPSVTFSGANSFCQGSSTNLSASPTLISASSTLFYNWSPSTGLSTTTAGNVIASPPSTTNYTVLLTLGSCTNNAFVSVTVNPLPNVSSVLTKTFVCPSEVSAINISGNAATYSVNGVLCASQNSLVQNASGGNYIYTVTGTSAFGCINQTTVVLKVATSCAGGKDINMTSDSKILVYPNPSNGDFYLKSENVEADVTIMNQLGHRVLFIKLRPGIETKVSGLTNGLYFLISKGQQKRIVIHSD